MSTQTLYMDFGGAVAHPRFQLVAADNTLGAEILFATAGLVNLTGGKWRGDYDCGAAVAVLYLCDDPLNNGHDEFPVAAAGAPSADAVASAVVSALGGSSLAGSSTGTSGTGNFSDFYEVMRALLGDRWVSGLGWHYADTDLRSALRSVFALQRAPAGYTLNAGLSASTGLLPVAITGDAYALIAYEACMILVGGEDGEMAVQTRGVTVRDGGDRKRDLLWSLREMIYELRDGGSYFSCTQTFSQWVGTMRHALEEGRALGLNPDTINLTVRAGVRDLAI